AGQRQIDLVDHALEKNLYALTVAFVLDALERDEATLAPDSPYVEPGLPRRLLCTLRPLVVGEDHGRRAARQKSVEQTHLGFVIGLRGGMIVHVVAAEIGKCAGGEPHTVEPPLVQTVAGGFHGRMRYPGLREFGQKA